MNTSDRSASLTTERAHALMGLAVRGRRRPVDALIERLRAEDGFAWLSLTLDRFLRHAAGEGSDALLRGDLTVARLRDAKERAKAMLADAPTVEAALGATACYLLVCASAAARRGVRIDSDTTGALDAALVDLADALPAEWDQMARSAAERETERA